MLDCNILLDEWLDPEVLSITKSGLEIEVNYGVDEDNLECC
ncbi:MAG: hypothetical protein PHT79_10325 [Syntrophomonadaceae bacterium]|nr:hypothetical protein [Syntrophomonadaceae bacterium]